VAPPPWNRAVFTAAFTQAAVRVLASGPVTATAFTLPLLPTSMRTVATPFWLKWR
jgi:hypothetical protein